IGISEVDADGRLQRVNADLAALLGYPAEELLGRSVFELTVAEDVADDRAQFRRQVRGELDRYTLEKRFRRADGGVVWVAVTLVGVCADDGRFLYAIRVQQDITARKAAEEALARRAEEQAALYAFTERLQHCGALADVYGHALDAIIRAL